MNLAQILKTQEDNGSIIRVDGRDYNNTDGIPKEFALMLAHSAPTHTLPTLSELTAYDLLLPLRTLLYRVNSPSIRTSTSIASITRASNQSMLLHTMLTTLAPLPEYTTGLLRETTIDGTTISMNLDIVAPGGVLKLLKVDTSSVVGKLADESRLIGASRPSLQQLYDNYPYTFKYVFELSIGRYLAPDVITADHGYILLHLTNNCQFKALQINSERRYRLYSIADVESFIRSKLLDLKQYIQTGTMPECTDSERGLQPAEFKVQKLNKSNKWVTVRNSKTDSLKTAQQYLLQHGENSTLKIHTTPAIYLNCLSCPAKSMCSQFNG